MAFPSLDCLSNHIHAAHHQTFSLLGGTPVPLGTPLALSQLPIDQVKCLALSEPLSSFANEGELPILMAAAGPRIVVVLGQSHEGGTLLCRASVMDLLEM